MRTIIGTVVLSAAFLATVGCSKPAVRSIGPEDNPEHHYLRGMQAIEAGDLKTAREKFDRALYIDRKFARAFSGFSIVEAGEARATTDESSRQAKAGEAMKKLALGKKHADRPEEYFDRSVAAIRVHTILKGKGWLAEAEDAYKDAVDRKVDERTLVYYQGKEAAAYFMGAAYLDALEFSKSKDRFGEVLSARREGKWHEGADKGWKKVDRIVRAMAGITVGDVAKKIAVKDTVSRGDLAALLVDEMKIDKLFAGRIPAESQVRKMQPEFVPDDAAASPFREEIVTLLKWKVRGMEARFNEGSRSYRFSPADPVRRGEMAFIMEDILVKLTGDEKIATAFLGHERSPFPDIPPTAAVYNAAMNVTTRGIMEGELSGEFRVNDAVEGSEALLAVRVLRQKLNIH